jgi:hypothetical protein
MVGHSSITVAPSSRIRLDANAIIDTLGASNGFDQQQFTPVIPEHRIPDGGVNADAGCASREDQIPDSESAQDIVQFGLIETAEPVLVEHHNHGLRSKLRDYIGIPRVPNQKSSLLTVGTEAGLADTEVEVAYSVRGVSVPEVRQVRPKAHLQVSDFDSRLARRRSSKLIPGTAPHYLLGDWDGSYGEKFHGAASWLGIREVLILSHAISCRSSFLTTRERSVFFIFSYGI